MSVISVETYITVDWLINDTAPLNESCIALLHIIRNQDANGEDDVPDMAIREPMPMEGISEEDDLCETDYLDGLCNESFSFGLYFDKNESVL